jgi:hypothetical protein
MREVDFCRILLVKTEHYRLDVMRVLAFDEFLSLNIDFRIFML